MNKQLTIALITCILFFKGQVRQAMAQDIHFSQYFTSSLSLNPALTGNFDGDWRLIDNYRSQWRTVTKSFNTNGFSYDKKFYTGDKNYLGMGLLWINDQSGVGNLTANKVFLSSAFHMYLKENLLSVGMQGGYVIKSINPGSLTFPDQYNNTTGVIDPTLPNNEALLTDKLSYFDVNAGINWTRIIGKLTPSLGISFFHVNKPVESFIGADNKLPMRTSVYGNVSYTISKKLIISPSALYMKYNGATEMILGSNISFKIWENSFKLNSLYAGMYLRNGLSSLSDAAIVVAGVKIKSFVIGTSYDVNISSLNTASNYKGAFEFSLIYTGLAAAALKQKIPCERY